MALRKTVKLGFGTLPICKVCEKAVDVKKKIVAGIPLEPGMHKLSSLNFFFASDISFASSISPVRKVLHGKSVTSCANKFESGSTKTLQIEIFSGI